MLKKIFNKHFGVYLIAGLAAWRLTDILGIYEYGRLELTISFSLGAYTILIICYHFAQLMWKRIRRSSE